MLVTDPATIRAFPDPVDAVIVTVTLLSPHGSFTAFSHLGAERLRALTASREALLAHLEVGEIVRDLRQTHGDGSERVWANLPSAEAWSLRAPATQPAPVPPVNGLLSHGSASRDVRPRDCPAAAEGECS